VTRGRSPLARVAPLRGRGSAVEHHLAKVRVAGSNPVVRSHLEICISDVSLKFGVTEEGISKSDSTRVFRSNLRRLTPYLR
jgi:hypothetical protein